jgi:hypothetical protein
LIVNSIINKKQIIMKTKLIIITLALLFSGVTVEAQLLKKLKKKAEKAIERTILKKTDSIVTKKTEKAIDSIAKRDPKKSNESGESSSDDERAGGILDILLSQTPQDAGTKTGGGDISSMGEPTPAPPDNNVKLPNSYQFAYQATIQVKSNQGTVETEYYLQPDETYYAEKSTDKDFTEYVVYDNERNIEVYFAEIEGKKLRARKKMDIFTKAKMLGAYRDAPNRTVKPIGNKSLLGYQCNGYEISTDAGKTVLWVTNEAPATMYGAMFANRAKQPNSPFTENTMIMEVVFTSKESADKNYQMVCTQIEPKSINYNLNDYQE